MNDKNQQYLLATRPVGAPTRDTFELVETDLREPGPGEVLVKVKYLSIDPAMRGWMNDAKSYIPPVGIGEVMRALGVGEVVASQHPGFAVGDHVNGALGVQRYFLGEPKGFYKVDPQQAPLPRYLSALGMTGMTAYFALLAVGQPKAGETVVLSGAAGAVGSVAGQIAKLKGCRVVGIAGGRDKCLHAVQTLGFDACIDHRAEDFPNQLARQCPKGIDIYFENVGGAVFDAVLPLLNSRARVPVCGVVAQYNATGLPDGPDRLPLLLETILKKRLRMQGFIIFDDYGHRYDEFYRDMSTWYADGRIKYHEQQVQGLENAPEAFIGLLEGRNFGKLVVALGES